MVRPRRKTDRLPPPRPSRGPYRASLINAAPPTYLQSDDDDDDDDDDEDSTENTTDHSGNGSTGNTSTESSRPEDSTTGSTRDSTSESSQPTSSDSNPKSPVMSHSDSNSVEPNTHTELNAAGMETENQEAVTAKGQCSKTFVLRGSGSGFQTHNEQQPLVDDETWTTEDEREIYQVLGIEMSITEDSDSKDYQQTELDGAEETENLEVVAAEGHSAVVLRGNGSGIQTRDEQQPIVDDETWTKEDEREIYQALGIDMSSTEDSDSKDYQQTELDGAGKKKENQEVVAAEGHSTVVLRGGANGIQTHDEHQPIVDDIEPNQTLTKEEKRQVDEDLSIDMTGDEDSKNDDSDDTGTTKRRRLDFSGRDDATSRD